MITLIPLLVLVGTFSLTVLLSIYAVFQMLEVFGL